MSVITQLERTTSRIIFLITDLDGRTGLVNLNSTLETLTMTLYDRMSGAVINNRNNIDVKGTNGFTLYDTPQVDPITGKQYNVLGILDPADNAVSDTGADLETHVAMFSWTWGANPVRTGRGEVKIPVRNINFVPSV